MEQNRYQKSYEGFCADMDFELPSNFGGQLTKEKAIHFGEPVPSALAEVAE